MIGSDFRKQHYNAKIYATYLQYVAEKFPHVSKDKILEGFELPDGYLKNEDNWLSVEFDSAFMARVKALTREGNIAYNAGRYALSANGLGKMLYSIGKHGLSLDAIYHNTWRMSEQYFNKVMIVTPIELRTGAIHLRLVVNQEILTPKEVAIVLGGMPDMIANTKGYYAAFPLIKNGREAEVDIKRIDDLTYELTAKYRPHSGFLNLKAIGIVIAHFAIPALVLSFGDMFKAASVLGWMLTSTFAGLIWSIKKNYKSLLSETELKVDKTNHQYAELVDARESEQKRFKETRALYNITKNLVRKQDEPELLEKICDGLVNDLGFDQLAVFLHDEGKKFLTFRSGRFENEANRERFQTVKFAIDFPSDDPTKISNVYRMRRDILVTDAKKYRESLTEEGRSLIDAVGANSFIAVPIASEAGAFGVIFATTSLMNRTLTEGDLNLLRSVGQQMAVALEKERMVAAYKLFVPFELLSELGINNIIDIQYNVGVERQMCIGFADIRGFTSMSQKMRPEDTMNFLNSYFSNLAPVLKKHNGIIDKFIGDGIMVLFKDPVHALIGVIEFQKQLKVYNERHRSGGVRSYLSVGIGLHYGSLLLGTTGFSERMAISVVSDSVNLASRIENLTKEFGVDLIISSEFLQRYREVHARNAARAKLDIGEEILPGELTQEELEQSIRFVGRVVATGRDEETDLYEVFAHMPQEVKELRLRSRETIAKYISDPNQKNLNQLVREFPDDPVTKYYMKRHSSLAAVAA
jgi:class 3 adenylate cyclase